MDRMHTSSDERVTIHFMDGGTYVNTEANAVTLYENGMVKVSLDEESEYYPAHTIKLVVMPKGKTGKPMVITA